MVEKSTLDLQLEPIRHLLDDADVTEVIINQPQTVITESKGIWHYHNINEISHEWCKATSKLIANSANSDIHQENAILSSTLPTGERVQIVVPPVSTNISFTIRRPMSGIMELSRIIETGSFDDTRLEQSLRLEDEERIRIEKHLPERDIELLTLFKQKQWQNFITKAVIYRKNIIFSGETGSGKTTLGNACAALIPLDERIITVEDTREMRLEHKNQVNLLYTRDSKGSTKLSAKQVLESTLRMRPDRVLLAELRGDETFFFIQNVINSGHPGTIATLHANSSKLAFRRLLAMIQASPEGSVMEPKVILEMLYSLIDIVVQTQRTNDGRKIVTEIYFDPAFSRQQMG